MGQYTGMGNQGGGGRYRGMRVGPQSAPQGGGNPGAIQPGGMGPQAQAIQPGPVPQPQAQPVAQPQVQPMAPDSNPAAMANAMRQHQGGQQQAPVQNPNAEGTRYGDWMAERGRRAGLPANIQAGIAPQQPYQQSPQEAAMHQQMMQAREKSEAAAALNRQGGPEGIKMANDARANAMRVMKKLGLMPQQGQSFMSGGQTFDNVSDYAAANKDKADAASAKRRAYLLAKAREDQNLQWNDVGV